MVAARLLKQPEWATWIDHELQGYPDGSPLPSYRLVRGELRAQNPVIGLIPLHVGTPREKELLSTALFFEGVSDLEALAESGEELLCHFPPDIAAALRDIQPLPMTAVIVVSTSQVCGLLEAVRNRVLSWALDLTDAGIQGEGMSFTPQEQRQAQQLVPVTIQITGGIHGGQIMVCSPRGQQQQTVAGEQKVEALAALLPWLAQVIAQGTLSREACTELKAELDTLKAQAASPNPKWPVIGTVAGSVRSILEGACGGVIAGEAQGWLATLTGC
ncbi:hypothetical protein [Aeromonas salmonicida]|uniref:AbiTii domain-containing protein n=2 Tax=Aeromonadaceae TaxID=84642 RepID=UPI001E4137C0|nr:MULTISPECIES: hypothetical protein [Aeromonas]